MRGNTPVLSGAEMRQLLKSIDTGELIGLRDRALLAFPRRDTEAGGATSHPQRE
jgi:hypothetical protein